MKRLTGKTAAVTGGGAGIGRAIALRFAAEGAAVHLLDRDTAAAEAVAGEAREAGGTAHAHACDVADGDAVEAVFADLEAGYGGVDILVNNAGIAHVGNLEATSPEDLDRLYAVNVKGVYHCLRAAVPRMVARGGGAVLNLASVASKVGLPDRFAYSMTKGAVLTMTLSVARDYIDKGVRSNCLCPARVHTPFVDGYLREHYPGREEEVFAQLAATQPVGRMGQPGEIAALAAFLCSDEAGFITGSTYDIDGGFTLLKM